MKTFLKLNLLVLCSIVGMAPSATTLTSPGVTTNPTASQEAFTTTQTLTSMYKFIFQGISVKGNVSGGAVNGSTSSAGMGISMSAYVTPSNGSVSSTPTLWFKDEPHLNNTLLSTALLSTQFLCQSTGNPINVVLTWKGTGNGSKPNAIFNIIGEYSQNPPPPVGSLTIDQGADIVVGVTPTGSGIITRE